MTDQNPLDSNGSILFPLSRANRSNLISVPSKSIADVLEDAKLFASNGDDATAYRWLFVNTLNTTEVISKDDVITYLQALDNYMVSLDNVAAVLAPQGILIHVLH